MVDASGQSLLDQLRTDLDCWAKGDTVGFGRSAAPNVTFFNNNPAGRRVDGRPVFRELMESWAGLIPEHAYDLEDLDVETYGDVGVISFVYRATMGEDTLRARGSVVYVRGDDGWSMVHTHYSNMDED